MTSNIDICNRALSEIGTRSTISSFDEGSEEGVQCGLWYDILRRSLLRTANWGFARGQVVLTQLGDLADGTSPYPILNKYSYPADAIKIRYLLQPPPPTYPNAAPIVGQPLIGPTWMQPSRANRFMISSDVSGDVQSRVILSNVCQAIGVYTRDITNPDLFDDLFNLALTAALSFKLVIPLSGNVGQKNDFAKSAQDAILQARVADGNEASPRSDILVDWIETRGIGSTYGYGPGYGIGNDWGNWYIGNDNMSWGM